MVIDLLIGFCAALLTSIPMLGPVVLLLLSAGVERRADGSTGAALSPPSALALGAALGEGVHVALVVFGLAPFLLSLPEIALWLRLVAGCALFALAFVAWRTRARPRPLIGVSAPRAFLLGAVLVLANPGFLLTWLAVIAFVATHGAEPDSGIAFTAGAVLGVLAWFAAVLHLARRLGPRLESRLSQVRALTALGLALLGLWLIVAALA
jgi:threonine/homoserine/homoserine lactone efflux protein